MSAPTIADIALQHVWPTPTVRVANVYVGVAAAVGTAAAAAVGADVRQ